MLILTTALLPFLLLFSFIFIFKKSVLYSVLISLFTLIFSSIFVWKMDFLRIVASSTKALFFSVEIILIILGALMILEILHKKDFINFYKKIFASISNDKRIYVLLIGWCLIYFLEGVAGFGTPLIIAIPLFLALGFSPVNAVIISLIGDTVPVIFGAIGLPIFYGIKSSFADNVITDSFLTNLSLSVSFFNLFLGIIIPLVILFIFTKLEKKPLSYFTEFIPFASVIALIVSLSAFLTTYFLGAELTSVIGGLVGIIAVILFAKKAWFLRKIKEKPLSLKNYTIPNKKEIFVAIFPYVLILSLLIITRLPYLPIGSFLISFYQVQIPEIFNFKINYSFSPFYNAGILMVFSALASCIFFRFSLKENLAIIKTSFQKIFKPFLTLLFVLIFVQIYVYSGENNANLPSMLTFLAGNLSLYFSSIWPFFAPFVGALGSFASGSATFSNLIFSNLQYEIGLVNNFEPLLILTLQALGAAAGNMVALHNVIMATTVANIAGKEAFILRKIFPVLLFYLLILALVGLIFANLI